MGAMVGNIDMGQQCIEQQQHETLHLTVRVTGTVTGTMTVGVVGDIGYCTLDMRHWTLDIRH